MSLSYTTDEPGGLTETLSLVPFQRLSGVVMAVSRTGALWAALL